MTDAEIKKDVTSKIGRKVGTVWGPCTVLGIVKDINGDEFIQLSEGTEKFTIVLQDWTKLEVI